VRTHVCTLACVHTLDACFYQVAWVDTRPPSSSAAFGPEPGPRRLTRGSWQQTRRRISSAQILKEVAFRAACQRREFPSKPFRNARRQCQAREAAHRRRLPAQRTTVDVEHEFGRNIRDGAARATPLAPQCPVGNLIARLQRRTCCEQVRSKCAPKKAFSRISTTCSTFSVVPTGQLGAQSKAGEYFVFYFSRRVNKWPFIFSLRPTTLKIFRSSDWRL
jgi:hypothetical protein